MHGVFFAEKIMENKTIYCPKCHRKAGTYDGKSKMNKICRCKNCNKRVIYHWLDGKTEIKPLRKRNCSSGITFGM
jgi:hypothetical protein